MAKYRLSAKNYKDYKSWPWWYWPILAFIVWYLFMRLVASKTFIGAFLRLFFNPAKLDANNGNSIDVQMSAVRSAAASGIDNADDIMTDAKALAGYWNTYKGSSWWSGRPYFVLWDFDVLHILETFNDATQFHWLCKFYNENATEGRDLISDITQFATSGTKSVCREMGLI